MTDLSTPQHTPGAEAPLLLAGIAEGIGTITLNRPEQMNMLTRAMIAALKAQLDAWRDDRSVRVIVLAAAGKAFCAGHDFKEMAGQPREEVDSLFAQCTDMMEAIRLHPKPVIAQVQGAAVAAGCQLVATCDLVVASETARFGTPGINSGVFCSTPMVPLSRVVPSKKALELLLTGDLIQAREAERLGLVNRVAPPDDLVGETHKLAAKIASKSPYSTQLGKAAYYRQRALDLTEAYDVGREAIVTNVLAPDGQEGIAAFLEKRPPRFES